ncbi:MAG: glycoside hydrolase family 140 protein, partial [Balneolaceae bacterium]|nr:glycoside hydrolase family 140 protein [Balneolaceae bacterium]
TRYLENRADKGFTVIQAVVLAELDGLNTPNSYGHTPLKNNDPAQPDEAYFEHVDFIVNKADELGLYIGMLPTWGDKFNKKWGVGPVVFTPDNARRYGRFLGDRYKNSPVIWILGGDRNPETETQKRIIRAMASGIREGDSGTHPITYHPQGGSNSVEWFHNDNWLDFNMFQSGHGEAYNPNFRVTLQNYRRNPTKPTLDGEPAYEDHPIAWNPENGWFDDFDVRRAAYWSMLAGALGHTYGNHNIWQMWEPGRDPISSARTPWYEAVDYPGAYQMTFFREFFESYPFYELVPAQQLVENDILNQVAPARAAKSRDNRFALIYIPHGQQVDIDLSMFNGSIIQPSWFNPRLGNSIELKSLGAEHTGSFDPPADRAPGNDWVLVLERKE